MKYKLELTQEPGNNQVWCIRGLEARSTSEGEPNSPDFFLWAVGMEESCDTLESIAAGVHRAIYDLLQTDERLVDGDVIESAPTVANKFHTWKSDLGTIDVPALRFECRGVHVVKK